MASEPLDASATLILFVHLLPKHIINGKAAGNKKRDNTSRFLWSVINTLHQHPLRGSGCCASHWGSCWICRCYYGAICISIGS